MCTSSLDQKPTLCNVGAIGVGQGGAEALWIGREGHLVVDNDVDDAAHVVFRQRRHVEGLHHDSLQPEQGIGRDL